MKPVSYEAVAEAAAEADNASGGPEDEEDRRCSLGEEGGVSRAHTLQRESVFDEQRGGVGEGGGAKVEGARLV